MCEAKKLKNNQNRNVKENMNILEKEIISLVQYGVSKGASPDQIRQSAEPLWNIGHKDRKQHWRRILVLTLMCGLISCLIVYDPVYRFLLSYARLITIQILPFWDWTKFYKDGCLLRNPYYKADSHELYFEDCVDIKIFPDNSSFMKNEFHSFSKKMSCLVSLSLRDFVEVKTCFNRHPAKCENIGSIERISNTSHITIAENYIKQDLPIVVTDGMPNWMARQLFSLQFLHQLYNFDEVLSQTMTCMLSSNIPLTHPSARLLLDNIVKHHHTNWYAHWENCERSSVRVLRRFFKRPYFLPPMVETAEVNWILISSNYDTNEYNQVDLGTRLTWLAQLQGENKIRLIPRMPCNQTCSTLYTVLREGEIVVWTDTMWLLDYQPLASSNSLNIAVGFGGFYD